MRKFKLQVMLSEEELKILDDQAARLGLSRSALIRSLMLEKLGAEGDGKRGGDYDPPLRDHCSLFTNPQK